MDKALAKSVLQASGVPVVDWETVTRQELAADPDACVPRVWSGWGTLFVKPSVGSSVGVRKVAEAAGVDALEFALRFDERVVVERSVSGREIECSCSVTTTSRPRSSARSSPATSSTTTPTSTSRTPRASGDPGGSSRTPPAGPRPRGRGFRGDRRTRHGASTSCSEGDPWVNEINTLPGFTSISMYPQALGGDRASHRASRRPPGGHRDRAHAERRRLNEGSREWVRSLDEV
ncbi:MAG: hypothetical protein R2991_04260 [Thermoanaerobaculia bacterium]